MPRRVRCPICSAKIVTAVTEEGVNRKGICSSMDNARFLWGNHYVHQYPVEILYVKDMSFWSNIRDKKTWASLIAEKPIYTPEECLAFHERWLKAQVMQ